MEILSKIDVTLKVIAGIIISIGVILGTMWKPVKKGLNNMLVGAIVEANKPLEDKIKVLVNDSKLTKKALCDLQRNSLLKSCKDYLQRGSATLEEKESTKKLYESYHALGGDSFITEMVNQVMNLPLEEERR